MSVAKARQIDPHIDIAVSIARRVMTLSGEKLVSCVLRSSAYDERLNTCVLVFGVQDAGEDDHVPLIHAPFKSVAHKINNAFRLNKQKIPPLQIIGVTGGRETEIEFRLRAEYLDDIMQTLEGLEAISSALRSIGAPRLPLARYGRT